MPSVLIPLIIQLFLKSSLGRSAMGESSLLNSSSSPGRRLTPVLNGYNPARGGTQVALNSNVILTFSKPVQVASNGLVTLTPTSGAALSVQFLSGAIDFGDACVYAPNWLSTTVTVARGEQKLVANIPAGKKNVFIELTATADIDLRLEAGNTLLLNYPSPNWGSKTWVAEGHPGMTIQGCTDACTASRTVTYFDGTTRTITGKKSYSSEWIWISQTTTQVKLKAVGYAAGTGTVKWILDCPDSCNNVCFTASSSGGAGSGTIANKAVTINPANNFQHTMLYTVTFPAGLFSDTSNNLAGGLSGSHYQFTTIDITPPLLTTYNPPAGSKGVLPTSSIVLTFNENMKAGTGNMVLTPATGAVITIPSASNKVTYSGGAVSIQSELLPYTWYTLTMASGVMTDSYNNVFAGISGTTYQLKTLHDCTIPNSNLALAPHCRCLDGFQIYPLEDVNQRSQVAYAVIVSTAPYVECRDATCWRAPTGAVEGVTCACGGNAYSWADAYPTDATCTEAPCNVSDSNLRNGHACQCNDGFAGPIHWEGVSPVGNCTPAVCGIEWSNQVPGLECDCDDGYNGSITWDGTIPNSTCVPALCHVPNSDRVSGPDCMCDNGFIGEIQWIKEIAYGNCTEAPCNVKNSNKVPGPNCRCDDGYNGTVTWDRTVPSGDCQPALCDVEHSTKIPGPYWHDGCTCKDGYNDTINWFGPETLGGCDAAVCEIKNSNLNPGSPCACALGFRGTIRWSAETPIGSCQPIECWIINTNSVPGPKCDCLDGYDGKISWVMQTLPLTGTGSITRQAPNGEVTGTVTQGTPVGICSPAPCDIENSNHLPGPACLCAHGYVGLIWWEDITPYGNCTLAQCNVENSNKEPGPGCACLPGFRGEVSWLFHNPFGPCNPIGAVDAQAILPQALVGASLPDPPQMVFIEGEKTVTVNAGTTFAERGPTCTSSDANTFGAQLPSAMVSSNVDLAKVGTYEIIWSCTDPVSGGKATITRKVVVVDGSPPTITLEGAAEVILEAGNTKFRDPGAKCQDYEDGLLMPFLKEMTVQENKVGSYHVTYGCTDLAGNEMLLTRQVDVIDTTAPVLTLTGGSTAVIGLNEVLGTRGMQCLDSADGALTPTLARLVLLPAVSPDNLNMTVEIEGTVASVFEETWDCTDTHSNKAPSVIRTVFMTDQSPVTSRVYGASPGAIATTTSEPVLLQSFMIMNMSAADADILLANMDAAKTALAAAHEMALGLPPGSVVVTSLEKSDGGVVVAYLVAGVDMAEYRNKRKAAISEEVVIGGYLEAMGLPVKVKSVKQGDVQSDDDEDTRVARTMFPPVTDSTTQDPGGPMAQFGEKPITAQLFFMVLGGGVVAIAGVVILWKVTTSIAKAVAAKSKEAASQLQRSNHKNLHKHDTKDPEEVAPPPSMIFGDEMVSQLPLSACSGTLHNAHAKKMHTQASLAAISVPPGNSINKVSL